MNTEDRYQAQLHLPEIGFAGQERLQAARVLVVGAGGLGCPALTCLTMAGVGRIGIMDHDVVSLSNLPRQSLYPEKSLGKKKAIAAAERLRELNSKVELLPVPEKLTQQNAADIINGYDLLLDCTDDLPSRYVINDACVKTGKPFVYAGIHRFEGQLSVFNYKGGPTYRCLFPEPDTPPANVRCAEAGVLGTVPALMGTWQANEAIKLIVGVEEVLSGKLLLLNLKSNLTSVVQLQRKTQPAGMADRQHEEPGISAEALRKGLQNHRENFQLVDLREPGELPVIELLQELRLPLSELTARLDMLDTGKTIVLYCQSGQRSTQAARWLTKKYGMKDIRTLNGGILAWMAEFEQA